MLTRIAGDRQTKNDSIATKIKGTNLKYIFFKTLLQI